MSKKRVMIGLSGGVDSAVAAYLLKQQGYEVIGGFMRNWDSSLNNDVLGNPKLSQEDICPQEKDYRDAQEVAKLLDIPLYRIDFIKEYWDNVFTYFLEEYKKGRTPNPDILCNKYIKFDSFAKYARTFDVDYIATGHYAKIEHKDGKAIMYKASDLNKDQTYFLCQVSQEQLKDVLFPLGDVDKPTVRRIAHELGLNVADKKDSTGICFIGERNFKEFLSNYLPSKDGEIRDIKTDKVVGKHVGVLYYTIGQRKGLGIGGSKEFGNDSWFVVAKDVPNNILYVSQGDDNEYLVSDSCYVTNVNIIDERLVDGLKCQAKFRYRQNDNDVMVNFDGDNLVVTYPQGIKSVTPGQEAVFYLDGVCLGGGTIDKVYRNGKQIIYK